MLHLLRQSVSLWIDLVLDWCDWRAAEAILLCLHSPCIPVWCLRLMLGAEMWKAEQHKMRSQLAAQFMPFFRLIARILTFRDKKYRILTFRDKKYRILTFCDKTELYLTVLQQNNVEACSLWLSLALSGSLWLPLARSCSLRLPIALRICVQHPRSAHKALAQLAAALLRCNTLCCSVSKGAIILQLFVTAELVRN